MDILAKIADLGNVTIGWLAYGPSTGPHKDDAVFHGCILKHKTPEWRILEMMTNLNSEKTKDKAAELVEKFIKIEKK